MSAGIPVVRGAQVVGALERAGFQVVRISGSHHVVKHPDGRTVSVPVHNRDIAKGTLRNILPIIGNDCWGAARSSVRVAGKYVNESAADTFLEQVRRVGA
jgi:predicted RNA binding protein YcfA (HicA-like mRNA interferase family)